MEPVVGSSGSGTTIPSSSSSSSTTTTNPPTTTTTGVVVAEEVDTCEVMPIGAGAEVGRSCILLKFKGKNVLLDCGHHPAYSGQASLPFFDELEDISAIDLLLVTHFHLDHIGALPYFLERTDFRGRVFMTHPTKAVAKMLLSDFVRVSSNTHGEDQLFNEAELNRAWEKIEVVHYHQMMEVNGIKFTPYNAGHVLGAAQFLIEIAGVRILYTGDYSREEDRHLMAAEVPPVRPEVLIVEATYGVQIHEPQLQREARFASVVSDIVVGGGKCLIPVFALGRAQELLLILEEVWTTNKHLHYVPVFFASQLAKKALVVYSTYVTYMNHRIRTIAQTRNPFDFVHVKSLQEGSPLVHEPGPCVVIASPGMLQSGYSRQLLEAWCEEERNGVVLTAYSIEGTMAKELLGDPLTIQTRDGGRLFRRCHVESISFSAHCDFWQTSEFIDLVKPGEIVLVHGERNQMARLHDALVRKYKQAEQIQEKRQRQQQSSGEGDEAAPVQGYRPKKIHTPENCVTVQIDFPRQSKAHCLGRMAEMVPGIGHAVRGVVVRHAFEDKLMHPDDLQEFTDLRTMQIESKVVVPMQHTLMPQLIASLLAVWADVQVVEPSVKSEDKALANLPHLLVCGRVTVRAALAVPTEGSATGAAAGGHGAAPAVEEPVDPRKRRKAAPAAVKEEGDAAATEQKPTLSMDTIVISWVAGVMDDMIADSVAALVCQCSISPFTVIQHTKPHHHGHEHVHVPTKQERDEDVFKQHAEGIFHYLVGHYGAERVAIVDARIVVDGRVTVSGQAGADWVVSGDGQSKNLQKEVDDLVRKFVKRWFVAPLPMNVL